VAPGQPPPSNRGNIQMKKNTLALTVAAVLACTAAPAFAITDEEGNASLQFSFVPPGARALGMGGAFIGLADDATAAYTNPAGLTQLVNSEVSAEYRNSRFSTEFIAGDLPQYDTANSREDGLGFLSYVMPFDNWAIAVYRHEFLRYSTDFIGAEDSVLLRRFATDIDVKGVNYGLSAAFRIAPGFSAGVGVAYSQFDLESVTERVNDADQFQVAGAFGAGSRGDDNDVIFNVGLLWKPTDRLSVGAVYRDGGNFEYTAFAARYASPTQLVALNGFPKDGVSFDVPRSYGIGLNYKVTDTFGINFDVARMLYSDLTEGMQSSLVADGPSGNAEVAGLGIDDGTEIRLGAEYVFADMANPVVIRAGMWRDPEHTIRFEGAVTPANQANAQIFSVGDDEMHYTIGLGIAFEKFQVDVAADFSNTYDVYSLSGVYRF
jgi:long-chain fatty acid transport protein